MKKQILLCAALLVSSLLAAVNTFGAARAPSNMGRDYLNGARSLSKWSIGAYYDTAEKDLEFDTLGARAVKSSKEMFYVGYDALPWVTPYVTLGASQSEIQYTESGDSQFAMGLGAQFNLLDHEIADMFLLEDRFRLNGSVEYVQTTLSAGSDDMNVGEFEASLLASIVNDVVGVENFNAESIALFGGPVYSTWTGSGIAGSQKSSDDFGYTIGLEVFFTRSVSMNVRANIMEHTGASAGLNVHF